ncbi:hypothetical protein MMC17_005214 [Xylographa soralifera]|nr:hypothetical protein [Xylographa soralifera]
MTQDTTIKSGLAIASKVLESPISDEFKVARGGPDDTIATVPDDDERLLAQIGYRQEFRREFNRLSTISFAISILGVLGSVPATIGSPLMAGGPATAVGKVILQTAQQMLMMEVAELVSAYPTAGGMYFVTKHVVPPEHVAIWSWCIGWCNLLGQTAGVSSVGYTVSQMILAAATLSQDSKTNRLQNCPSDRAPDNTLTVYYGGHMFSHNQKLTQDHYVVRPVEHPGVIAWTMTDYDGATHMSEETHNPAVLGPIAIRTAVLVSGIVGWMLTVTFCFCMNDFDGIMESPTGLPAAQIFLNAGGKTGGTIMWFWVILIQFFTGCAAMLADTRMAYAFARDDGLPFSGFWSKVNVYTHTPINAVWLVVFFSSCLNLIGIGSTQTVVAIFNITAPALDLSYIAVIIAHLVYEHRVKFVEGPYTLGALGKPINAVAICWVSFISVVLLFPTTRPVTAANMNYAVAVAAFIVLFSLSWWWIGARKKYTGPRTKDILRVISTESSEDGSYSPRSR